MKQHDLNEHQGCLFIRPPQDPLDELRKRNGLQAATLFLISAQVHSLAGRVQGYEGFVDQIESLGRAIACEAETLRSNMKTTKEVK